MLNTDRDPRNGDMFHFYFFNVRNVFLGSLNIFEVGTLSVMIVLHNVFDMNFEWHKYIPFRVKKTLINNVIFR